MIITLEILAKKLQEEYRYDEKIIKYIISRYLKGFELNDYLLNEENNYRFEIIASFKKYIKEEIFDKLINDPDTYVRKVAEKNKNNSQL